MKKKLMIGAGIFLALALMGSLLQDDSETVSNEVEETEVVEEVETVEETEEETEVIEETKRLDKEIEIEDEFKFENLIITFDTLHAYEKDGSYFLDIELDWRNLYRGDTSFNSLMSVELYQDGQLEEVSGVYDDKNSIVYFPNVAAGLWFVDFTFELEDATTPVKVVFVPTAEDDESQEVTIEIE